MVEVTLGCVHLMKTVKKRAKLMTRMCQTEQETHTVNANSLVVWVIGLLVSLCPYDTLHVARPAKLTSNKCTW